MQPDGRLLLVIGDVAGRGIAAASTMGQLRSAMRAYMRWAVDNVMLYTPGDVPVQAGAEMPRWSWDGLQHDG